MISEQGIITKPKKHNQKVERKETWIIKEEDKEKEQELEVVKMDNLRKKR